MLRFFKLPLSISHKIQVLSKKKKDFLLKRMGKKSFSVIEFYYHWKTKSRFILPQNKTFYHCFFQIVWIYLMKQEHSAYRTFHSLHKKSGLWKTLTHFSQTFLLTYNAFNDKHNVPTFLLVFYQMFLVEFHL